MVAQTEMWAEVINRLGLEPHGPTEDGVLYLLSTADCTLELHLRVLLEPIRARIVVRPQRVGEPFVAMHAASAPTPSRWKTGQPAFDERVAILAGGRALLPRLGPAERERLALLVAEFGAIVSAEACSLEPAVVGRLLDARTAVAAIRELMHIAVALSADPPVLELIARWLVDDGAPMVASALGRRVVELLPTIGEADAERACAMLLDQRPESALPLLSVMPPFACVLSAWFQIGDPLDPRVAARVIEAWASGVARPAARYLVWLLHRTGPQWGDSDKVAAAALGVVEKLTSTPGLLDDDLFVREFARAVTKDPPPTALPLLLRLEPHSPSSTVRVAKALASYPGPQVHARLASWLGAQWSAKVRGAAATALASRALTELVGPARPEILDLYRQAALQSSDLLHALVEQVPLAHTAWLVSLRPQIEPDAVSLIRRLGRGGADVDAVLLWWMERGSIAVKIEAARALGRAGSPRAVPSLQERAGGWFSDGGLREACRAALDQILERHGGAGSLARAEPERPTEPISEVDDEFGESDLATAEVARDPLAARSPR